MSAARRPGPDRSWPGDTWTIGAAGFRWPTNRLQAWLPPRAGQFSRRPPAPLGAGATGGNCLKQYSKLQKLRAFVSSATCCGRGVLALELPILTVRAD